MGKIATQSYVASVLGGNSSNRCATKKWITDHYNNMDRGELAGYIDSQLVGEINIIKNNVQIPAPVFHLPMISDSVTELINGLVPDKITAVFDAGEGAFRIATTGIRYPISALWSKSGGLTFSIQIKRAADSNSGSAIALTTDGLDFWWAMEWGIRPYDANYGKGVWPYLNSMTYYSISDSTSYHTFTGTVSACTTDSYRVMKMYIDGVLVGQVDNFADSAYVGCKFTYIKIGSFTHDCYNGWYRNARVWNEELTQEQIQRLA